MHYNAVYKYIETCSHTTRMPCAPFSSGRAAMPFSYLRDPPDRPAYPKSMDELEPSKVSWVPRHDLSGTGIYNHTVYMKIPCTKATLLCMCLMLGGSRLPGAPCAALDGYAVVRSKRLQVRTCRVLSVTLSVFGRFI